MIYIYIYIYIYIRVSTGPGKMSVHFPVRENENFTKIQGKLREFHFRKIPGFPGYSTTKMAIIDNLILDIRDFINFFSLFHQKITTIGSC